MQTRSRFLNETAIPQPTFEKPKDWKSPLRDPLFQVVVEETDGSPPHFVGPAWKRESADNLCEAIAKAIKTGVEKTWANPMVVPANIAAARL